MPREGDTTSTIGTERLHQMHVWNYGIMITRDCGLVDVYVHK